MRRAALLALLLCACAPTTSGRQLPGTPTTSPAGATVYVPSWVRDQAPAALEEIDIVMFDLGIDPREVPIVIQLPVCECADSPTGLARGWYDWSIGVAFVGWRERCEPPTPLLPALRHELEHHLYGPEHGH